ncbi:MAG: tetratricopeptide repeat protein [Blastocatellia bacterium]
MDIQIVEISILQHRYSEAIKLCQDVLGIIDNPNLTQPDLAEPKAKAPLYRLLGDTYKASGNLQQAQEQYQKASISRGRR